ncbi:MAG: FliM/FliN family flagellar motor switch protein [Thermoleophilaceae bacterium]
MDFSRPSKFTKDQERRLAGAHETFCRTAGTRLSSELRLPIDFEVVGHKQLTWTSAAAEVPAASLSAVIQMRPIDRQMLLAVDREFLLALIERLLGGTAEPPREPRRLTDVDMALAKQLLGRLLDQLSIVWQDMVDVELDLAGFEADAESALLAPLSEPTWILSIEARVRSSSFPLVLVIPYRSIAPIEQRLAHGARNRTDSADTDAAELVQAAIGEAKIELRAEVGAVELTAEDVLALQVGDLIRLGASAAQGVTMYAGDVPVHRARPGRSARRRAVQVLGRATAEA